MMQKKLLSVLLGIMCFAINGLAGQIPLIQVEYRELANQFHVLDHLTESIPSFFLVPDYKKEWIAHFGELSEMDCVYFKAYQALRKKYQNTSFFDKITPSEKSGLFAPDPNDIVDTIAEAFYTSQTIEAALEQLNGKLEPQELQLVDHFFALYKDQVNAFAQFDRKKLEAQIECINRELSSQNGIQTFSESIAFYKATPQEFKSILAVWGPKNVLSGISYSNHLQIRFPVDDLPADDLVLMQFLASVILHEATHHISGTAPSEQKKELTQAFLQEVNKIERIDYANVVEEPLVMAHQMRFVKIAYPEWYSEDADWFNHPLAKHYLVVLEEYVENMRSIDTTFMIKLAEIYKKAHPTPKFNTNLHKEIIALFEKDQQLRNEWNSAANQGVQETQEALGKCVEALDQVHSKRLKEIVREFGWPGYSLVGPEGSHAFWLLVQHTPDPVFQTECLELLKFAVLCKEASAIDLAYLTDRVLIFAGKKQIYGTQVDENSHLLPIEDSEHVDERRAEIGLPTFAEYFKLIADYYQFLSHSSL